MLRTIFVAILFAGLAATAAATEDHVYKWVDAAGQIHYTDLPPTQAGARLLAVLEREAVFLADEEEEGGTESAPPPATTGSAAAPSSVAASVQQDVTIAKSEQCQQAQERYRTYVESRRLYRQTPDGQREYLTDEELMRARIEARQAMDDLCG